MKIQIDNDSNIEYESHSFLKKNIDFLLVPILNAIPNRAQKFIKKTHYSAKEVIENATTHRALENLYQHGKPRLSKNILQKLFHSIWFNTGNSKAVRNRLKLVTRELTNNIRSRAIKNHKIQILSIASGSARAVILALNSNKDLPKDFIEVTFVDKNETALEYSKNLYQESELHFKGVWVNDTAGNFIRTQKNTDKFFDIIEMVGLLDYFSNVKALEIFKDIHKILKTDGCFITANIIPNPEIPFVTKAVGWRMEYRTPHTLLDILVEAGFDKSDLVGYCEPLGIHCVAVART